MSHYLDIFSLDGKVSLVTGGGRGIGLGIARALAGAGSDLVLAARTPSQLEEAAALIRSESGRRVETVPVDLGRLESVAQLARTALGRFGRIDILVNNAGWNIRKPFLEVTPEEYQSLMDIQLRAPYFLSQHVARAMIEAGRGGKIINLASLTSRIAVPNISIYGAAKGGIYSLTKALALELAPHKITANAVAPGYVRTAMTEPAFADDERRRWMLSRIPLGSFGEPDDIGRAALFLASPAADYITGEVLFVDGGWMAG